MKLTPQQSLEILVQLSNLCIKRGGVLESVQDVNNIILALSTLEQYISETDKLSENPDKK